MNHDTSSHESLISISIFVLTNSSQEICQIMAALDVASSDVQNSTLNPLAKEFVPSSIAQWKRRRLRNPIHSINHSDEYKI